jgi:hypothetical protein
MEARTMEMRKVLEARIRRDAFQTWWHCTGVSMGQRVVEDRVRWNIAWYAFSAGWHAARRAEDDPPTTTRRGAPHD